MRATYDATVDALYVRLASARITDSAEARPGIVLDYDAAGQIVGVEVLDASQHFGTEPRRWSHVAPPANAEHEPTLVRFDENARAALLDLLTWRRDVRRFRRGPLPEGAIERLVRIACLAPSVGLSQPWRFVLVEDAARRRAVRASFEACNAAALRAQADERAALYARLKLAGLDDAPCQFAVFADRATGQGHGLGRLTMPETIDYSAVMAVHTLWLAARAEGIGLGWVSILDPAAVKAALDVPASWVFIGYFCLGYPQEDDSVPALEREGWEQRCDSAAVLVRR